MNRRIEVTLAAAALTLCAVKSASANFLYDVSSNVFGTINTHVQFTVPNIFTSTATQTAFSLETVDAPYSVVSLVLNPVGGICSGLPGPCIQFNYTGGSIDNAGFDALPAFTSVGTFTNDGSATVAITETLSSAVPEPATALLLPAALGAFLFLRRRWKR